MKDALGRGVLGGFAMHWRRMAVSGHEGVEVGVTFAYSIQRPPPFKAPTSHVRLEGESST